MPREAKGNLVLNMKFHVDVDKKWEKMIRIEIEGIQVSRRIIQNLAASAEWCRNQFEVLKRAEVPMV